MKTETINIKDKNMTIGSMSSSHDDYLENSFEKRIIDNLEQAGSELGYHAGVIGDGYYTNNIDLSVREAADKIENEVYSLIKKYSEQIIKKHFKKQELDNFGYCGKQKYVKIIDK